jgi:hypothetical protein
MSKIPFHETCDGLSSSSIVGVLMGYVQNRVLPRMLQKEISKFVMIVDPTAKFNIESFMPLT